MSARGEPNRTPFSDTFSADERTLYDHTDDERYERGKPSLESSEGDHNILESEDERERLLTAQGGFGGKFTKGVKMVKRESLGRAANKQGRGKAARDEESSSLMCEIEVGAGASSGHLSRHSSEDDKQTLLANTPQRKARRLRLWRRTIIYGAIAILFIVLIFVAYRVSKPRPKISTANMVSNGTSLFAPTTILISLDGFRADFLYRGLTPTLNKFIANGISPKYMLPSFPSVTFPNHYTMATGLYPEAHGIVGNSFWDPSLQKEFYYTDPDRSQQPFWWGGEPLWVTAERQQARAAVHMWPGSEAHISHIEPVYVDKFNGSEVLPLKVDRIFELLDLPGPIDEGFEEGKPRPQLIAAYVPNVDADGHTYGPNSTEIRQTINDADTMLGSILDRLHERNLTDIVNVVVVSDHGMATTDVDRLIQLEDLVDPSDIEHTDGWPLYGLRLKNENDLNRIHKELVEKSKNNPNVDVYLRDKDMPERYHFSNNERIAPLWIIPKPGWAIVEKHEFDVIEGKKNGDVYHPRGLHGYDFENPLMRAIFVARGPAFPHEPNSRVEPFQNIELYNIICDSIGIIPAPNNGTLRLPLKPVGLHSDPDTPPNEIPTDPMDHSDTAANKNVTTNMLSSLSSIAAVASGFEDTLSSPQDTEPHSTSTSSAAPASSNAAEKEEESWWKWLTHKADSIGDWVDGFLHDHNVPEKGGG